MTTDVRDRFAPRIQGTEADLISEAHVNASPGPVTVEPGVTTKAPGSLSDVGHQIALGVPSCG